MEEKLEATAKGVYSPYTGRILEIEVANGDLVNIGTRLFSIEPQENNDGRIKAILYVSSIEGKKVSQGMEVQISPSTVKREEYGVMLGKVTYVAEFPSTRKGMMRVLDNEFLVQTLCGNVPPLEVHVEPILDSSTKSGYKWSSSSGPPYRVYSGTMCEADIIIGEQRPISFVIPFIMGKTEL
jgi:HlyD family secretion protein